MTDHHDPKGTTMTSTRRLAVFAALVLCGWLVVIARTPSAHSEQPPTAACAHDPQGRAVHCRCLTSKPQGLPVDDPADCPPPPLVIVDCVTPAGDPCPTTTTTTAAVYAPTAADLNDVPAEPQQITPGFTG